MKRIIFILFLFSSFLFSSNEFLNKVNLGLSYLKLKDYERAVNYFNQAKNLSPDNPVVYYYLGEAYFRKGDLKKAMEYYKEAIEREPKNPDFHYSLGYLYLAQNDRKKAIEEFNKVLKIAPQSFVGEKAKLIKEQIEKGLKEESLSNKWAKLEEEERKKLEEEKKKKEKEGKQGPGQMEVAKEGKMPIGPGMPDMVEKKEEIPIEKLVKRIKYGTKSIREKAAKKLPFYSSSDIAKVYKELMNMIEKEKNIEVEKNLIKGLGKVNKPEVGEFILSLIQNEETPFEVKIIALESIDGIRTKNVIVALRTTLDNMVKRREREREEARENIKNINDQIDKLQVEKIALGSEINKLQQDRNKINSKLQEGMMVAPPEAMGPPEMMESPPGVMGPPPETHGGQSQVLSKEEVEKLQSQLKNIDKQIEGKRERLTEIDEKLRNLQEKRRRYEMLLARKGGKVKISAPTYRPQTPPGMVPPGMEQEFMPGYTPQEKTTEEENEVIFAMNLIIALGKMGDKDALPVIKKAWKEFGVSNYKIYYALTLARLGDYSRIKLLLAELKQDYPQTQEKDTEVKLRADIVKVLGQYLKTNPDEEIIGLISYLSEEAQYPEIRKVASNVLATLSKEK